MIVLGIGTAAWTVLLWRYAGAGPGVELDAIRTAGTLIVGAGGFAALLLAARRQRSTELTLEHQREVAQATERDAAEQRITELYTRAVDQLGNGQAPVRLGGLHALERLAQDNPDQRQTIVDVICAYLRMPYRPPDHQAPGEDAPEDAHRRYERRRQELQVRLTAQRILTEHLRPQAAETFWGDIDLDLAEAHLHLLDMSACRVRKAMFERVTFAGDTEFERAQFTGHVELHRAKFAGNAGFREAKFAGRVGFNGVRFTENAWFAGAQFTQHTEFDEAWFAEDADFVKARFTGHGGFMKAQFAGNARYNGAQFSEYADFNGARFSGFAWFDLVRFSAYAWFKEVQFAGDTYFGTVEFPKGAGFEGARVASDAHYVVLPVGWATRAAQPAGGEEEGWLYVVRDEAPSEQLTEAPSPEEDPRLSE